jgi:hypothetical protein
MSTYTAHYETGWRATVRAESASEARRRLAMTGRGERFRLEQGGTFSVWGRDADDDYEDGE